MRHMILLAILVTMLATDDARADLVVFSESVGTSPGGALSYGTTVWQNENTLTFTGWDGRYEGYTDTAEPTSSGYTGSSGGRYVYLSKVTNAVRYLTIGQINTVGLDPSQFTFSFGVNGSEGAFDVSELRLSFSTDGTNYTTLQSSTPPQSSGDATTNWRLISYSLDFLPAVSNLNLRFANGSFTNDLQLDDISLVHGVQASAVPEPASIIYASMVAGAAGLHWRRRRGAVRTSNRENLP